MRKLIPLLVAGCVVFSSCKFYRSNLMLKTPKDFKYDVLVDSLSGLDYRIASNDLVQYRVFPNNGFKLIDLATSSTGALRNDLDVIVESDDSIRMPMLGRVKIGGLTLKQAEKVLQEKYSEFYVDPYVSLRINNKRVIVFPGNGGAAKVLTLVNNNTTVMEALAYAGGIVEDGKAYKVKLIRNNPSGEKPFVYLMDLSRIDGLADARSKVQSGDIIYVEPRYRPLATFTREIAPVLTLMTSLLILYQFSRIVR